MNQHLSNTYPVSNTRLFHKHVTTLDFHNTLKSRYVHYHVIAEEREGLSPVFKLVSSSLDLNLDICT